MKQETVYLPYEWKHWLINTTCAAPIAIVTTIVSFKIPELQYIAGAILGLCLGMLHNVLWAYLIRKKK